VVRPDVYNQLMSLHGTFMIFFWTIPVMAGISNYVVPIQIGARDMAFPRVNAFSFWLLIPANKIVAADVTSIDVVHSWFMPEFGVKMDANPGRVNHTWFQVERPGTYRGQCAELCGVLHGDMLITVQVVTPEEFDRWIEQKKKGA
jgi:cytochrome c oxidase subunit 2